MRMFISFQFEGHVVVWMRLCSALCSPILFAQCTKLLNIQLKCLCRHEKRSVFCEGLLRKTKYIYFVKQKTVLVYLSAPLHKRAVFRRTSCLVFFKTIGHKVSKHMLESSSVCICICGCAYIYVLSQSQSLKNI